MLNIKMLNTSNVFGVSFFIYTFALSKRKSQLSFDNRVL